MTIGEPAAPSLRPQPGWPALKAADVDYTIHMYDNVNHAFHNDTTASRYDEAAALAWSRTIAFFNETPG